MAFTKGELIERMESSNNEFNAVGIVFMFSGSSKQAIHHSKTEILSWKLSDVLYEV